MLICRVERPIGNASHTDYGRNVTGSEYIDFHVLNFTPHGYPDCDPDQFMAWFHLPSIRAPAIWLRSFKDVIALDSEQQMRNLHILVLARSTIKEEEVLHLLSKASLTTLHLHTAMRQYLVGVAGVLSPLPAGPRAIASAAS